MDIAMGIIQDLLTEVPLSAVLKERIALTEQKYEGAMKENADLKHRLHALEEENATLRAQIPKQQQSDLDEDTARILVHFFRAEGPARDVGIAAQMLKMEKGVVQYHLDQLKERGFADWTGGNYIDGHTYWGLTPAGRKYAVQNKII